MDLLDRYASAGIPAIDAQDKILVLKNTYRGEKSIIVASPKSQCILIIMVDSMANTA